MTKDDRIAAFSQLGQFLNQFSNPTPIRNDAIKFNDSFFDKMKVTIEQMVHHNGWFTLDNVTFSINQWSNLLTEDQLNNWLQTYTLPETVSKKVGIIMAGNIPLVGFHDFLSVLITGNTAIVKLSSHDNLLVPLISEYLIAIAPKFKEQILFSNEKLTGFEAIIATGSDNTARYFEHYFGNVPNIIRKNRNSVAILTGTETEAELQVLGEDIFTYFGLGCRSVSKILVPNQYNFDSFFKAIYAYNDIVNNAKYANNYDYNKAVYLMSEYKLLDNGFLMLKEDTRYSSPIATIFYETYEDKNNLKTMIAKDRHLLQCIVGNHEEATIPFGKTQHPKLTDYADGKDIIEFLANIN
ncbi:acyl-CoA reductase [Aquimarina sp. W85]|uniref:acyl-CoA reductase n=1 Tax=Aquimarina rhodophyticola TaxID=3342246 RepID=UPI00366ED97C